MDLSKYLNMDIVKKVVREFYVSAIYPAAKEYVESTENEYDDKALEFLHDFIEDFLKVD